MSTCDIAWDAFLDAYCAYLHRPTMLNAAALKLAGDDLETADARFSMRELASRLGWDAKVSRLVGRLGRELPPARPAPRS